MRHHLTIDVKKWKSMKSYMIRDSVGCDNDQKTIKIKYHHPPSWIMNQEPSNNSEAQANKIELLRLCMSTCLKQVWLAFGGTWETAKIAQGSQARSEANTRHPSQQATFLGLVPQPHLDVYNTSQWKLARWNLCQWTWGKAAFRSIPATSQGTVVHGLLRTPVLMETRKI